MAATGPPPPDWEPIVCGLLWHDGRLLITRRAGGLVEPELWEFPGGHQVPGEPPEEAVRREFEEELGLRVQVGRLWMEQHYRYPEGPAVWLRFYLCKLPPGTAPPSSTQTRRWVYPPELALYTFPAANALVVTAVQEEGMPGIDV